MKKLIFSGILLLSLCAFLVISFDENELSHTISKRYKEEAKITEYVNNIRKL